MPTIYTDKELLEKLGKFCDELGKAASQRDNFDEVKNEFIRVVNLIGHIPKAKEFDKYSKFCSELIVKRYGWNNFIKMCDFETSEYSEFDVLLKLQIYCNELGRKPTFREIANNKDLPSIGVYKRRFGSLNVAIDMAANGLSNKPHKCDCSKELVIKDIKRITKQIGKIPTRIEFDKYTKTIGSHLISNRYGWKNILEEIGLIRSAPVKYSEKILIDKLKEKNEELGRIPVRADFSGSPNASTFFNRFGNWENALEKAGFDFKRKVYLSRDGHKCYSTYEYYIDNWLYERNISHEKDKKYPFHKKFNKNNRKTVDWYINGVYIEFCGMIGRKNYDKKMKIKKKLIKQLNLKIIFIYPTDLDKLDKIIPTKFGRNLHNGNS